MSVGGTLQQVFDAAGRVVESAAHAARREALRQAFADPARRAAAAEQMRGRFARLESKVSADAWAAVNAGLDEAEASGDVTALMAALDAADAEL
ncbi:MAG TPA: hypothetical protein PK095_05795, partial [Myxococcota bacterium]|nr:hypothetical protein [Myxococcota bacterium]